MYNHAIKSSFLNTLSSMSLVEECVGLFRFCEPAERELSLDICHFDNDNLNTLFSQLGSDYIARDRAKTLLLKYFNFCKRKNLIAVIPDFDSVFTYLPTNYVYECVSNPIGLQNYLDLIFAKEELNTVDNIYRGFFWMAFSGLNEKYIETLTADDVDLEMSCFSVDGRSYQIYNEGLKSVRNCKQLEAFNLIRSDYQTSISRFPGNLFLRGIKANPNTVRIRNEIMYRSNLVVESGVIKKRLTYTDIRRSGIFYRVYEEETSSRPILTNPRQLIINELMKVGFDNPIYTTVSEYLDGYIKWKKAFR